MEGERGGEVGVIAVELRDVDDFRISWFEDRPVLQVVAVLREVRESVPTPLAAAVCLNR